MLVKKKKEALRILFAPSEMISKHITWNPLNPALDLFDGFVSHPWSHM